MHMLAAVDVPLVGIKLPDKLSFSALVMRMPKCSGMPGLVKAIVMTASSGVVGQSTSVVAIPAGIRTVTIGALLAYCVAPLKRSGAGRRRPGFAKLTLPRGLRCDVSVAFCLVCHKRNPTVPHNLDLGKHVLLFRPS